MSKPLEIDEESLGLYIKAHLIDHRFHNSNKNPSEIQIAEIAEYDGIPVRFLVQAKTTEPEIMGGPEVMLIEPEESLNDDSRPERASEHTAPDATVDTSDGGKSKPKRAK